MEVYSNQPGVQFYTANFLPDESSGDKLIVGKDGANYMKHGAFCLETQNFPDAVNHVSYVNCNVTLEFNAVMQLHILVLNELQKPMRALVK
jgi:galactose mutarotase-like enzyme